MAERPVPLTLREPARGEIWGRDVVQMSGLEMLRAYLERRLPDPPITKLTGLRLSEASLGVASASMPASPGGNRALEGDVRGPEFWDSTPGIEVMTQVATGDFIPPCYVLMGLRGVATSEGAATLAMHRTSWLCNAFGLIFGGAIAFLSDAAMIVAVGSTLPAGTAFNTMDLKINFLRPVLPGEGELTAQAKVIYRGRTVAVANCEVRDPDGKLAAQATASFLLLPGRYWETPVHVGDEISPETS